MGWFWNSSDSGDGKKPQDPLRDLDPGLRDFLAKESPVKYSSTNPPSTTQIPTPAQPKLPPTAEEVPSNSRTGDAAGSTPNLPTLFPDGRYAHLWKNYRPLNDLESEGKSDQEKINDILEGYNQRKTNIGKAALENCALEQCDVNDCFTKGGWKERLTMCREENRKFERCYMMQSKFLKALGYLSTYDRPPEVDEQIQMHADTLYHKMLDQEKQIEAAKADGRPVPSFPPLLSSRKANSVVSATTLPEPVVASKLQLSDLPPKAQADLKKRLEGLTAEDREVEEQAITAEIQASEQVAGSLEKFYGSQEEARQKRKEQGKETMGDRITALLRFR